MNGRVEDRARPELAVAILQYLRLRMHARDTVEGITEWWLRRQRIEETVARVFAALDYLEELGFVLREDGRFSVDSRRTNEIDEWLVTARGEVRDE